MNESGSKRYSVTDTVTMYGCRVVGKNVPYTHFTYFIDEAESWISGMENCELVKIEITPIHRD